MIPRYRPPLRWKDILQIPFSPEALISDWEGRLATASGYSHAVWFPYGRVAVRAYLESLAHAHAVVLTPFNCTALAAGITAADKAVQFVDTEPNGFNQDPALFQSALRVSRKHVGILVHQWGIAPQFTPESIPNPILHDKALCDFEKPIDTLKDEDAVLHSFGWGKPLAGLRGAILCTHNRATAATWKKWQQAHLVPGNRFRDSLQTTALRLAFSPGFFGLTRLLGQHLGIAKQLSGKTEAGGLRFPKNWSHTVCEALFEMVWNQIQNQTTLREKRREQVETYQALLAPHADTLGLPPHDAPLSHYPIRLHSRTHLQEYLLKRGVFSSAQLFDTLLCDLEAFRPIRKNFPNARQLASQILHLPLHSQLTRTDQHKIVAAIIGWVRQQRTTKPCYSTITDGNSSIIPN